MENRQEYSDKIYRTYIKVFGFFLIPLVLFVVVHFFFLWNAGELQPYRRIVQSQMANDSLYVSALNGGFYGYKMQIVQALRPDVLVLGSSRTMKWRADAFTGSFANAGGVMRDLGEGVSFLEELLPIHQPKIILMGLDFRWFNKEVPASKFSDGRLNMPPLTQYQLTEPLNWLKTHKIGLRDYLNIARGQFRENPQTHWKGIGVQALLLLNGFRKDGYYFHGQLLTGDPSAFERDAHFVFSLRKIQEGNFFFERGSEVNSQSWEAFERMVFLCRKYNIKFVTYFPPIAQPIHEKMQALHSEFSYIDELTAKLKRSGVEFYDFRAGASIGAENCEFIDGTHPGDTPHYRVLNAILLKNPSSALVPFAAPRSFLEEKIRRFKGRALAEDSVKETDYLNLGCAKNNFVASYEQ